MNIVVIPDPKQPGLFAVAVHSLAGINVVGGRLIRSTTVRFPEDSPTGLTEDQAEDLADRWQAALDEQAGVKEKKIRKRKESKVLLKQWDQASHPESR